MLKKTILSIITAGLLAIPTTAYSANNAINIDINEESTANVLFSMNSAVPGEKHTRKISVTNKGISDGELVVKIINLEVNNTPVQSKIAKEYQSSLEEYLNDLTLNEMPINDFLNKTEITIHENSLKQDETDVIEISYELPAGSRSGNASDIGETKITFGVAIDLRGVTEDEASGGKEDEDDDSTIIFRDEIDGIITLAQTGFTLKNIAIAGSSLFLIGLIIVAFKKKNKKQVE